MIIMYRECTYEDLEALHSADNLPEKLLWDFHLAKKATHFYGAKIDGAFRAAIAFSPHHGEPIDEDGDEKTLSYIDFLYVSRNYCKRGIATHLLRYAIDLLISLGQVPIGIGFTSSKMKNSFLKYPADLKDAVVLLRTALDDGQDAWEECGL